MKYLRGTSIIEIVIATALISVSVIAALSLTNHSQKQNTYAKSLAEATKYNNQATDWIRTQRSLLGWTVMASKPSGIYCLNTFPANFNNLPSLGSCAANSFISGTIFQRQITLDTSAQATGKIKITTAVIWLEKIARSATTEMELTSWH